MCEELGDARELFPVLYGLCLYHLYAAELPEARAVAERLLRLAETDDDRGLSFFAHRAAGVCSCWMNSGSPADCVMPVVYRATMGT